MQFAEGKGLNAAARYTPSSVIAVIEKHNYYFCHILHYRELSVTVVSHGFAHERTRSARLRNY